ncbi:Sodium-coupled monocarboxylate transporter 1, partial [Cichlidogyrus casuarinus]
MKLLAIQALSAIDYVLFAAVLLISLGIGVFFAILARKVKNAEELLNAAQSAGLFPVSMSLLASFLSAITLLGTPPMVYETGTMYAWILLSIPIVICAANYIYIPVFYNCGVSSPYEYLGERFKCRIMQLLGALVFSFQMVVYMGIVLYVPCLAIGTVTGITVWGTGGLKAVLWTDAFQVGIMAASVLMPVIKGSIDHGGFTNIWNISSEGGRIIFNDGFGLVLALLLSCLSGLVLFAEYGECNPTRIKGMVTASDQILPYYVATKFSIAPGSVGIFIAGIVSASLSTVSSGCNSLVAVAFRDIMDPFFPPLKAQKKMILSKFMGFGFGGLTILFAYLSSFMGAAVQAALGLFGILAGPLLGIFTLGMLFPFANKYA